MKDELQSLHDNHTFELVKLPKGKRALKNQWVYRLKQEEKYSSPRYKARLFIKVYTQKKGVDFEEIFSPVVKISSIRTILCLPACYDLEFEQLDVKTVFLHGDLEEELYMEQPEGFVAQGKDDYVCRLKKRLYGLKQAHRQWYKRFESVMGEQGYKKTTSNHFVFVKRFSGDNFVILFLYVDDMLIVGRDASIIDKLKLELIKSFTMKDLGPSKQILGIKKEKEEMQEVAYFSVVGSLMYAMVYTRSDLAYVVGTVSRFLSNLDREHLNEMKWIMRYPRDSSNLKLCFGNEKHVFVEYTDSDMAEDIDSRRSTSVYLITYVGGVVAWQSRLQKFVCLIHYRIRIFCSDRSSAIHLGKDSTFHAKSKHIDVMYQTRCS
ncbi:hypothetical protein GQ457_05G026950 [Hibiscus cannabinus]